MNYEPAVVVGVIIGLSEILKGLKIPTKYIPIFNVVVGVGIMFLGDLSVGHTILTGVIIGLTASRLYDLVGKPIRERITRKETTEPII